MASPNLTTYTFGHIGALELRADVYVPDSKSSVRGGLLWFHGGALLLGGRQNVPTEIVELGARSGFVVVSADYRLAPQATISEIAEDVTAALEWVRSAGPDLFGVDSTRVMVAGNSAGGYLAILLGASDPRPAAVLAYYGYGTLDSPWYTEPSAHYRRAMPLLSFEEAFGSAGDRLLTDGHERNASKFYLYCRQNGLWPKLAAGFDPQTQRAELRRYSPTYHVTADYPPTLLLHGTADTDVPHAESAALAAMLALHSVPVEFISLKGLDHGLAPGETPDARKAIAEAHSRVADFVRRHLTDS